MQEFRFSVTHELAGMEGERGGLKGSLSQTLYSLWHGT